MLIECVPNFSEGRRPAVIAALVATLERESDKVKVLNVSSDADHNRTVVTFAGSPAGVTAAALAAIARAAELIDLNQHQGVHPRLGATDVVPFVPLQNASLADCVALARRLGEQVGRTLNLPVYLYAAAATRPERENLADIRRGEYEQLQHTIATDPRRAPDFGPRAVGPAGAVVIGARNVLIAYNLYLNTAQVDIARRVARAVRYSSGGLPHVKAIGLLVHGRAQVSLNLTDFTRTSLAQAVAAVRQAAALYGAQIERGELVGMLPQAALAAEAPLDNLTSDLILENRLSELEEIALAE